jgi:hypothetical protein
MQCKQQVHLTASCASPGTSAVSLQHELGRRDPARQQRVIVTRSAQVAWPDSTQQSSGTRRLRAPDGTVRCHRCARALSVRLCLSLAAIDPPGALLINWPLLKSVISSDGRALLTRPHAPKPVSTHTSTHTSTNTQDTHLHTVGRRNMPGDTTTLHSVCYVIKANGHTPSNASPGGGARENKKPERASLAAGSGPFRGHRPSF